MTQFIGFYREKRAILMLTCLALAVGWWEENADIIQHMRISTNTKLGATDHYCEDLDYKKCCAALGRGPVGERRD